MATMVCMHIIVMIVCVAWEVGHVAVMALYGVVEVKLKSTASVQSNLVDNAFVFEFFFLLFFVIDF